MRTLILLVLAVLAVAGIHFLATHSANTQHIPTLKMTEPKPRRDIANRNVALAAEKSSHGDIFAHSRAKNEFREQYLVTRDQTVGTEEQVKDATRPQVDPAQFQEYRKGKWIDSLSGLKMRDQLLAEEQKDCDEVRCPRMQEKEVLLIGVVAKTRDDALQKLERRWQQGSYVEKTPAVYYK